MTHQQEVNYGDLLEDGADDLSDGRAVSWTVPSGAKKKPKPVVMGTDSDADWGSNVDAQLSPIGQQLGMELTEASISPVDKENLNFVIKVSALPGSGGIPEFVRYVWTLTIDDDLVQLDGRFTNYHRGACDPTAGTCPPPRDPGEAPSWCAPTAPTTAGPRSRARSSAS